MKTLYEKSLFWKGKFNDFKEVIDIELNKFAYLEEAIKKGTVHYMTGEKLNNLTNTNCENYDKWIYAGIEFDNDVTYKCILNIFDYEYVNVYKFLYITEAYNSNNQEQCEDSSNSTCCMQEEPCDDTCCMTKLDDLEMDEFYYMPEDLWSEDATVIRKECCYLWYRTSEWKRVEAVNESNFNVIKECVDFYKEKYPEISDPLSDDTFWHMCVGDDIISNALKNRDYIYELDYANGNDFKKDLKQFDVVFQETLGGFVCHPYVVYDIEYQNAYEAKIEYDDYANEELNCICGKYSKGKIENWRFGGFDEYRKRRAELIKEGHATYTVKPGGTSYRMNVRWVDRSNKVAEQPYGELKKDIW
ncbi:MAG: hypothetical protein [Wendovervirus sonii]|uniref:Uncharacterized protein n=1 Tax=phage Lak_Megaphage_Sonny TaxID=3109229 RepID=A0ABZ0Z3H1_9CAUD|nr:MAG: hypothetical protein [phage Lak_Megaphage_Sonny]